MSIIEIEKVLCAKEDYEKTKKEMLESIHHIRRMIEDLDNPLYKSKYNDGGVTHVGSLEWCCKHLPEKLKKVRKLQQLTKDTERIRNLVNANTSKGELRPTEYLKGASP